MLKLTAQHPKLTKIFVTDVQQSETRHPNWEAGAHQVGKQQIAWPKDVN